MPTNDTIHDPVTEIATEKALKIWLQDRGLEELFEPLAARGLIGTALLDMDQDELATIAGGAMKRLTRLLAPLHRFRAAVAPALNGVELDASTERCCALGREWLEQKWLSPLTQTWPGPIAHEIHMLGELLLQGKAAGALWQMRDAAEVLIKIPAVILACDVLNKGGAPELENRIRRCFFGTSLSMGSWLRLVCDLAKAAPQMAEMGLLAPEVAKMFYRSGKLTLLYRALEAQTNLRNWDMGHGANRFFEEEVIDTLRHYLLGNLDPPRQRALGLNKAVTLAEGLNFAHDLGLWHNIGVYVDRPKEAHALVGWNSILEYHRRSAPASGAQRTTSPEREHSAQRSSLLLVRGGHKLSLAPFLSARSCALCGYCDVFVFNGWDRRRHRFDLLDYLIGHRMRQPWHQATDLYEASQCGPDQGAWPQQPADDSNFSLRRASVIALLDDTAMERRYLSPDYLRAPLRAFIEGHARGVFWLQGPGHVGKSMFVFGLAEGQTLETEQTLLEDLRVAAVFIRKEYRYGREQIFERLEQALKRTLDVAEQPRRRLPRVDLDAADPPAALVKCIAEYLELSYFSGRLLICLDGLDELRPPERTPDTLDFIPVPDQLPDGVYILLSSRPTTDRACPEWIAQQLGERLDRSPDALEHRVNAEATGYRKLLHGYFDRETQEVKAKLEAHLVDSGQPAKSVRAEIAQRFGALFDNLVRKADGLFLYFAFLLDRIKDREIAVSNIDALPKQTELFSDYLDRLIKVLAPKQFEVAKALLLVLAAVEQAHAWYLEGRTPPFAVDPGYHGVPLDTLAKLIHYPDVDGHLLYVLLRLRPALGSWRGKAKGAAHYRLGLKGLTEAIAKHSKWCGPLRGTHRRLAKETLALFPDAEPESTEEGDDHPIKLDRLRYGYAHAALSKDSDVLDEFLSSKPIANRILTSGSRAFKQSQLSHAVCWYSLTVLIGRQWPPDRDNDLAAAYVNRGNARAIGTDLSGALEDYDRAIKLKEALRERLGEQWPPGWVNDLANAYMNRGNALTYSNNLSGALENYDRAIKLMERLREQLGKQWLPDWGNDLAGAYMNRGNSRQASDDLNGALEDYSRAIEVRDTLRTQLGDRWPPGWCNDLAKAYTNRANARVYCNDLNGGFDDYGRAIKFMEGLRDRLSEQWLPEWGNDLAAAYTNRGNAHAIDNNVGGALKDFDRAIKLKEALRKRLGQQLVLRWDNDLAATYTSSGIAHALNNNVGGALKDFDRAIKLKEALCKRLGQQLPPDWYDGLAQTYRNRGLARVTDEDINGALSDFGRAIMRWEALVYEGHFNFRSNLFMAYHNALLLLKHARAKSALLVFSSRALDQVKCAIEDGQLFDAAGENLKNLISFAVELEALPNAHRQEWQTLAKRL